MKRVFTFILVGLCFFVKAQVITTIAGTGTNGYTGDGGQASLATFLFPSGMTFDKSGNLYIVDTENNVVRKIDTSGIITTVAGDGVPFGGYSGDGGPAISARLYSPSDVAFDAIGNMYITDLGNHVIREVNTSGIITTFAGTGFGAGTATGGYSGDGGPATSAKLNQPDGLVLDATGNVYFVDSKNFVVRKINTAGKISTIAGNGFQGYSGDGGPAIAAKLYWPTEIALDAYGNIYVSDEGSSSGGIIRKIDANGIITTFGGGGPPGPSGSNGFGDGLPATAIHFGGPVCMKFDAAGNLYFADGIGQLIRKINTGGIISTVAGIGTYGFSGDGGLATAAMINSPCGIAIDTLGNLFFSDQDNQRIRKVTIPCGSMHVTGLANVCLGNSTTLTANGATTYTWSANAGGVTTNTVIVTPASTTTYTLFGTQGGCSDTALYTVIVPEIKITGDTTLCSGQTSLLTASGTPMPFWQPQYISAYSVSVNPTVNTTYTVSTSSGGCSINKVFTVHVTPTFTFSIDSSSSGPYCPGSLLVLNGVGATSYTWESNSSPVNGDSIFIHPMTTTIYTVMAEKGYCIDSLHHTVNCIANVSISGATNICPTSTEILTGSGATSYTWAPGGLNNSAISVSPSSTTVYSLSGTNGTCVTSTTHTLNAIQCQYINSVVGLGTPILVNNPFAMVFDSLNNMFVIEGQLIKKIDSSGVITLIAGNGTAGFGGDGGPAIAAQFYGPNSLLIDKNGDLLIIDYTRIRRIDHITGIISTIVGNTSCFYLGDGGLATNASLCDPRDFTMDSAGNLYIADGGNFAVRKVNATTGIITTIAGTGVQGYSGDGGPAISAKIQRVQGIAVDKVGNVYISDEQNFRIRKIDAVTGVITTVVGNGTYGCGGDGGPATMAQLSDPKKICLDSKGNLYITDWNCELVRMVDTLGIISTVAGNGIGGFSGDGSYAIKAMLALPLQPAFDSKGYFYILDYNNSRIRKVETCNPPSSMNIISSGNPCYGGETVLTASGGISYHWCASAGNFSTPTVTVSPISGPTTFTVTGYRDNVCKDSASITVNNTPGCIWPGDTDENLVVDNFDLLPIGIEYGRNGFARANITNNWQGYMCNDWADTLNNGVNVKYVDCNGDSIIDFNDTVAVNLNYGQTHPARSVNQIIQSSNPDVYLTFNKTLYYPGDTVFANVNIGNSSNIQSNFYGTALSINYDNNIVKSATERFYFNDSWLGKINQSKIKISKIFPGIGKVDIGVVRITHTDTGGYGKIATFSFVLRDTLSVNETYFTVTNAIKTNAAGNYTSLNFGRDSVAIIQNIGVKYFSTGKGSIIIYPNPAENYISLKANTALGVIAMTNSLGETVFQTQSENNREQIDISKLPQGIYLIKIQDQNLKFIKE